MAKVVVEHLAILGITDTPDNPSAVVRRTRCKNPVIYRTEICNPRAGWREDNGLIRFFMGIDSSGYSISPERAEEYIKQWRPNWAEKKDQIRAEDL